MNKVNLQNLDLIITNKCNLNCEHCNRGKSGETHISKEVINASFEQINKIDTLIIDGGEPSLALLPLYHLYDYLRKNHIDINRLITIINGSIYSQDFLDILEGFASLEIFVSFHISSDSYHTDEIEKLGISKHYKENLIKYRKSAYYSGIKMLNKYTKLFREGNAVNLDETLTMPIKPSKVYLTYLNDEGVFDKKGTCNIGPMLTINQDGIITEYDASFENQKNIYNYGNVLNDSIEEVCLKRGKVLKPRKFFDECDKELKKYNN